MNKVHRQETACASLPSDANIPNLGGSSSFVDNGASCFPDPDEPIEFLSGRDEVSSEGEDKSSGNLSSKKRVLVQTVHDDGDESDDDMDDDDDMEEDSSSEENLSPPMEGNRRSKRIAENYQSRQAKQEDHDFPDDCSLLSNVSDKKIDTSILPTHGILDDEDDVVIESHGPQERTLPGLPLYRGLPVKLPPDTTPVKSDDEQTFATDDNVGYTHPVNDSTTAPPPIRIQKLCQVFPTRSPRIRKVLYTRGHLLPRDS